MATASPKLASYENIIDADGHMLEPPDAWEKYIDPKFRERALRIRAGNDGKAGLSRRLRSPINHTHTRTTTRFGPRHKSWTSRPVFTPLLAE